MDITVLFKACVKTVRTRNKAFGVSVASDKSKIFVKRPQKGEFILKVKDVVDQITRLRDFLLEHRKAYLNFSNHLSDSPRMLDTERDQIDTGAQRIINTCSHQITNIKREISILDGPSQLLEHHRIVIDLVGAYLKAVCEIYSEQKLLRVRRAVEFQKLSKLELELPHAASPSAKETPIIKPGNIGDDHSLVAPTLPSPTVTSSTELTEERHDEPVTGLSAEELQLFEMENMQLYNELNSLTDEVRQIESKVVRIAELQEVFTEKVLQQDEDIERIATTVVGSTEDVKDANEQIRQAIQRNAGLRVWVLFFLLVMSFSLLFLDWYND